MNTLFGNSIEEVGDLSKNLILKTAGKVKILFGKKCIDLLDSNGNLNFGLNNIIKKVNSEDKIVSDGFYYCNGTVIACVSGNKLGLASDSGNIYVSFLDTLESTGELKYQALKNIGFIYKSLSDIKNYPTSGIIYVELEKSLYVISNGNISKYLGNIPNPLTTQVVITKDDNLEGSLVISGTGINNSIKLNNLRIYNNENLDSIFSSGGTLIFSIDNREVASLDSEGLKIIGILSMGSNINKGFNIYKNNDNEYVLNIDIIKVRKNIEFKDSTLYSPEFGLDDNLENIEDENLKYLKYPRYSLRLYNNLLVDLNNPLESTKYDLLVLPFGVIKNLLLSYITKYVDVKLSSEDYYWYIDNYIVDVAIDDYMIKYYNIGINALNDPEVIEGNWNQYSKDKRTLIMQAALIPSALDGMFYSTKYFSYEGDYLCKYTLRVSCLETVSFETREFKEIDASSYNENNENHYKIEGAFAGLNLMRVNNSNKDISEITTTDLSSSNNQYNALYEISSGELKVYNTSINGAQYVRGNTYDTYVLNDFAGTTTVPGFSKVEPYITFFKQILSLGDFAGRSTMYRVNRGRTRPLNNNNESGLGRYPANEHTLSEATGHRLNSIFNRTLVQRYSENAKDFLHAITVNELNTDGPASYPSGHASQTWAVAMLLAQAYNNDLNSVKKYMRNSYIVGLQRSIARFHWNSDIMYGRLWASMFMPIINANPSFDSPYNNFLNFRGLSVSNTYPINSNYSTEFNNLIGKFNMINISSLAKLYLNAMYIKALEIFDTYVNRVNDNYDFLFTDNVENPVYYEVYPTNGHTIKYNGEVHTVKFRGENTTYNVENLTRKDIYISWFIGLCLTELYVNSATIDNNQTKIMAKSYILGGGRELDLYNEYKIDYDPMILRYAAGAVYMILRGKFSRSALRNGGIGNKANFDINDNWAGATTSNFLDTYKLGYCIDTYKIFPNAPGPYNELYGNKVPSLKTLKPYQTKSVGSDLGLTGQLRQSQFIIGTASSTNNSTSEDTSNYDGGFDGIIYIKIQNNLSQTFITNGQLNFEFISPDPNDKTIHYSSPTYASTNRVDKHGRFSNNNITIPGHSTVPNEMYYSADLGPLFKAGKQYNGSTLVPWNGIRYLADNTTTPKARHGSTGAVIYNSNGTSYEVIVQPENPNDGRYIVNGHKYTLILNSLVTP